MSALKVKVSEEHEPFIQFLTRLVGIIGGVFTCSGLIHRISGVFINCFFCRFFIKSSSVTSFENKPSNVPIEKSPLLRNDFIPTSNAGLVTPIDSKNVNYNETGS